MRFIKKQLSWWPIVLIVGGAAFAIPVATRVNPTAIAGVQVRQERQNYLAHQTPVHNEDAFAKYYKDSKAAVGPGDAGPQDDYYDRRREYWEKRIERELDEEDLDDQTGDDKDDADAKDSKADKDKDDADDEDGEDDVDQEIERRREYWRRRVERDW